MAITEQELAQAEARMAETRAAGHAVSARYDRRRSRVVVALNTGVELTFPTQLAEGLADASPDNLADIEISPAGLGCTGPSSTRTFTFRRCSRACSDRRSGWSASSGRKVDGRARPSRSPPRARTAARAVVPARSHWPNRAGQADSNKGSGSIARAGTG